MKFFKEYRKFKSLVRSDLARYYETAKARGEKEIKKRKINWESFIFKAGFQATFLYRLAHFFYCLGWPRLAWGISRLNITFTGAEIEYNMEAGPGLMISHPVGIVIGRGSKIGENVTLFQGVTLGVKGWQLQNISNFPVLENRVMIFTGAKIIGGIKVGSNSLVGANAVVIQDIPPDSVAIGVPAKFRPRNKNHLTLNN